MGRAPWIIWSIKSYSRSNQEWITSEWRTTENKCRARFYDLTRSGRKQLAEERRNWERLSQAVNLVLEITTP